MNLARLVLPAGRKTRFPFFFWNRNVWVGLVDVSTIVLWCTLGGKDDDDDGDAEREGDGKEEEVVEMDLGDKADGVDAVDTGEQACERAANNMLLQRYAVHDRSHLAIPAPDVPVLHIPGYTYKVDEYSPRSTTRRPFCVFVCCLFFGVRSSVFANTGTF